MSICLAILSALSVQITPKYIDIGQDRIVLKWYQLISVLLYAYNIDLLSIAVHFNVNSISLHFKQFIKIIPA